MPTTNELYQRLLALFDARDDDSMSLQELAGQADIGPESLIVRLDFTGRQEGGGPETRFDAWLDKPNPAFRGADCPTVVRYAARAPVAETRHLPRRRRHRAATGPAFVHVSIISGREVTGTPSASLHWPSSGIRSMLPSFRRASPADRSSRRRPRPCCGWCAPGTAGPGTHFASARSTSRSSCMISSASAIWRANSGS